MAYLIIALCLFALFVFVRLIMHVSRAARVYEDLAEEALNERLALINRQKAA